MTWFEPRLTSAYGDDLCWRMVWQKEALKYSYEEVGSNLGVDRSTVVSYNWKGKQETISQGICKPPGYFQPLHSCI